MAEGTYDYACMRAELLGVDKPDYEEFLRSKTESDVIEAEEADTENLREADIRNESMKGISGKLDELNSILQGTQKKLNNFKASCGSLTNLLKIKVGRRLSTSAQSQSGETASVADQPVDNSGTNIPTETDKDIDNTNDEVTPIIKSDLTNALDNHFDRIDNLIEKAERNEISMGEQSKEMKRFLDCKIFK